MGGDALSDHGWEVHRESKQFDEELIALTLTPDGGAILDMSLDMGICKRRIELTPVEVGALRVSLESRERAVMVDECLREIRVIRLLIGEVGAQSDGYWGIDMARCRIASLRQQAML